MSNLKGILYLKDLIQFFKLVIFKETLVDIRNYIFWIMELFELFVIIVIKIAKSI